MKGGKINKIIMKKNKQFVKKVLQKTKKTIKGVGIPLKKAHLFKKKI